MTAHAGATGPFALNRLSEVRALASGDWLVAIQFGFVEGFLSIEVDAAFDEVAVSFQDTAFPVPQRWSDTARHANLESTFAGAVGLSSAWRWVLHNQQGYQDGFQIEFGDPGEELTWQFLVVASRLEIRRVVR